MYVVGKHNVFKVNGPDFQACNVPPKSEEMATGNDVIMLTSPGQKWYMCGKANGTHCQKGMKLVINVLPANEKAPAPYYSSPSTWKAPPPSGSPYTGPKQHVVGDGKGWTLKFNYTAWAEGRQFRVGDTLVFNYAVGAHNVFKVSGSAFEHCSVPPENEAMATGNDVITLATPGKKWYICGKAEGMHCWSGMKLVIDVLPSPSMEHAPVAAPLNSPALEAPALAPTYSEWETPPVAPPTGPRKFFVGDDKGWTLSFNYTAWAEGKEFRVGDILVFKYPVGVHNVLKVDGPSFQACNVPPETEALSTGYDKITLASPGRKWYMCGKASGKHCQMGQKLVINVLPSSNAPLNSPAWKTPAPPPSALPVRKQFIVGDDYGWTLDFNYTAWAEDKEFHVGDRLVFKYVVGKHNVFKVDGPAFQACHVPPESEALTTGYDVVTLASPGRKWYICGKAYGEHCQKGQKLVINVLPATWQNTTQPSPPKYAPSPRHGYGRKLFK
ncbi:uncharacterized protein A4U43_C03F4590 [Asparagus officinalis]|uniref:Phytocyanin domain-containing protein n=2 Tax=Asparagus officinalis TaxID=4686 RepID=A0A5P1F7C5_ASPOF|nr:uncharacterized protein A4U43_C03F4590 [Asparagus officinalis]